MRAFSMRCKVISTVFNLALISLKKFSKQEIAWLSVALLLGVPAAYALSRFDFKGKSINAF